MAPDARCQKPTPMVRDGLTGVEPVTKPHDIATLAGTAMGRSAAMPALDASAPKQEQ